MRSRNNNTDDSRYYFDWLEFAAADLLAAKVLCENGSCNALSAFHCQQAIEKGLKGFILKSSKQLKDGHSLIYLCRKASAYNDDFEPYFKDCAYVNQFYIESRYPADVPETLSKQDAEQCLSIAERVLALCE